jgi:hypothetical protein
MEQLSALPPKKPISKETAAAMAKVLQVCLAAAAAAARRPRLAAH